VPAGCASTDPFPAIVTFFAVTAPFPVGFESSFVNSPTSALPPITSPLIVAPEVSEMEIPVSSP
jgi:hypothetical protein